MMGVKCNTHLLGVSANMPTPWDVLLPPKCHTPLAAVPGLDVDPGVVEAPHLCRQPLAPSPVILHTGMEPSLSIPWYQRWLAQSFAFTSLCLKLQIQSLPDIRMYITVLNLPSMTGHLLRMLPLQWVSLGEEALQRLCTSSADSSSSSSTNHSTSWDAPVPSFTHSVSQSTSPSSSCSSVVTCKG